MKLLFDENLSPKLPRQLELRFPGSVHVRDCGLKGRADRVVWEYARDNGFNIVSKDGDFHHRILLMGAPPKLIWLCIGNCTRDELLSLLVKHEEEIRRLEFAEETILILP
jgi:predicted nuclease of predicted toxin-antitoxin system